MKDKTMRFFYKKSDLSYNVKLFIFLNIEIYNANLVNFK